MDEENESPEQGAATETQEASAMKDRVVKVHAAEAVGSIVAAGERLGEKVAHLGESAEGTLVQAKERTVHVKDRVTAHAGPWANKIREAAPKLAKRQGAKAKNAAGEHPKGALTAALTALGVSAMALLRRTRRPSSGRD
jgi:hypothetical protein